MKRNYSLLCVLVVLIAIPATAQTVTQTFSLRAGWNSIFLEVQPAADDPASVFGAVPNLQAVWMWNERPTGPDFIKDASEAVINEPGWLGWFPNAQITFLSDLKAVPAHRAYLLYITGSTPQTLSVTGAPFTGDIEWIPDSLNLAGLHINPANRPTFANYLAASPAHAGRAVYALDAAGIWQAVNPQTTNIEPGIAYWFDVAGASSFQGPITIRLDGGDSLEFGQIVDTRTIRAETLQATGGTLSLRVVASPDVVPLKYFRLGTNSVIEWPALPSPLEVPVVPDQTAFLRIAVDRTALTASRVASILEVTTSAGGLWRIPVGASRTNSGTIVFSAGAPTQHLRLGTHQVNPKAGLWVGTVTVDKVSNAQMASTTPVATEYPFRMRLIVHVDQSGKATLLKDVLQMWQNGTGTTPGRFVLLTKDSLVPLYQGASLRDGTPVARRLTTIGFDFDGSANDNQLAFTGTFGGTGSLTTTIDIPRDFPTNPFRHKFHPDHNNSDPAATFDIRRVVTLTFSATDPAGAAAPGYGDSIVGGTYAEKLTKTTPTNLGLHKNDIYVAGTFRLQLASLVNVLNQ